MAPGDGEWSREGATWTETEPLGSSREMFSAAVCGRGRWVRRRGGESRRNQEGAAASLASRK